MANEKFYIVAADALPEVFLRVAEARRMLQVGEADTVGEAVHLAGLGCAGVTVTAETSEMHESLEEMMTEITAAEGVLKFEILAA